MKVGTDSSNQRYVDVPCMGEHVRLTFIPRDKAGYQKDSLRVQIRAADGHLRPEFDEFCASGALDPLESPRI
jgi:hypothetical protein